jgi:hypothetical protein
MFLVPCILIQLDQVSLGRNLDLLAPKCKTSFPIRPSTEFWPLLIILFRQLHDWRHSMGLSDQATSFESLSTLLQAVSSSPEPVLMLRLAACPVPPRTETSRFIYLSCYFALARAERTISELTLP